jgi:hypothetical protein
LEVLANKILQIPISQLGEDDFITWPHNKIGVYTVRSVYFLACGDAALISRSGRGRGMSSGEAVESKDWKALWAIRAPGKMKITLWRFIHDCLPSGYQLVHRHVPISPSCIHCFVDESVEHAMLLCPFAHEVWDGVKSVHPVELNRRDFANPKQWTFDFLRRCTDQHATTLAVTFWHLWDTRNKIREAGGSAFPSSVVVKINSYVGMILAHLYKNVTNSRREPILATPWAPQPVGYLMINVDAALFASSASMGA